MKNWVIDHIHSTIGFEVKHMMVSKVRGQFLSFTAEVKADDLLDLTTAKVVFKLDGNSINTRNQLRDKHLKSADFFDVPNYPTIDFISTFITKNEDSYKVTGDLTIKDTTKPVTFDVVFGGKAKDLDGIEVYGFEAEALINREEFGLTWNAALETGGVLVGKEVRIIIELELNNGSLAAPLNKENKEEQLNYNNISELMTSEQINRMVAENINDFILITDKTGVIHYANPSLKTVSDTSIQHSNFFEHIHPEERDIIKSEVISISGRTIKKSLKSEFRLQHAEGYYLDIEADISSIKETLNTYSESELVLVVMREISERKEAEKAIYQLAFNDHLTNLPNRRSFMNELRSEVIDRRYSDSKLTVLFIDLDNFKQVNDQWGHDAGDIVLKEAADRIKKVIRPTDVVARFGGDEFIVMIKDVKDVDDVIKIVDSMLEEFQYPINISNQETSITCSISVAHFPEHGKAPDDLVQNADTALYYVKDRGKSDYKIFNQDLEHQSLERRLLENALRQGINNEQFYLEYQPKVNLITNKLMGMEALVRWKHPELGIISPGKFIPLAEESGLIVLLGEWILRESCRQATTWQSKDYPHLSLSVNISVRQLEDIHFVTKLKSILQETEFDPTRLELEITESVLANIKSTIPVLHEIKKLGVQISIDDFGTGYSSLSYIKEFPIDTLKIDQSFIRDIHTNKESKEIARAIIKLAKSIGLRVIAEGIELEEHVDELSKDGCILGQGYYYSKPLNVDAFEDFMVTY